MEHELNTTENTGQNTENNSTPKRQGGVLFKSGAEWKGNKNGRPKGSRNLTKIFEVAMDEVKERAKKNGKLIEDPEIEIILTLCGLAQKGNPKAMELYMKYKYGNPTQPIDITADIKTDKIEATVDFFNTLLNTEIEGQ